MNYDKTKIICPRDGSTRYVTACEHNCTKRGKCAALDAYRRPFLFNNKTADARKTG